MNLYKNRFTLKLAATLIFLAISYLMLRSVYFVHECPVCSIESLYPLPLVFALIIMTSWFFFGLIEGLTFLFLALLTILLTSALSNYYAYNWQILILAGLAWFIVKQSKKKTSALTLLKSGIEDEERRYGALELEYAEERSLKDALVKKNQRYLSLEEIVESLSRRTELEETVSAIVDETFKIIGKSSGCFLFLVDKEKQSLALSGRKQDLSPGNLKSKTGDIFDHWVFKQRQPLLVEDIKNDFRFDATKLEDKNRLFKSLLAMPLLIGNKITGVLRLEGKEVGAYHQDDLRLLGIIANIAALALENALLYKETEELAITDGLTGLYVHNYFHQRLSGEINRGLRKKKYFSLLMIDIDRFKDYNDRYGHSAGDIVLKSISKIIKSSAKGGNIAARYGGEEFCIFLPLVDKGEAMSLAEDLRKKVEEHHFLLRRVITKITVSIGVVSFPSDGQLKDELIQKMDKNLYEAKRLGRNRVCCL